MKLIASLCFVLAFLFHFSCKKENVPEPIPDPGPPAVKPPDTLGLGWKKIPFIGSPQKLNDIFFVGNTGFCISANTIYKTTNAGVNWTESYIGVSDIYNIGMGSDTNAIFVGSRELIVTHNGGINFEFLNLPDSFVTDVFFVSTSTAYLGGKSIWKTTNGGDSWTKLHEFVTADGYKSLYFINDQTGWVIRKNGLFKTTNGGINWNLINTGSTLFNATSVFFTDTSHGLISDNMSVTSTKNGGSSWTKIYEGTPGFHDIHFISSDTGYITDKTYILKTIDGGISWNKEVVLPWDTFVELHFTDANHGWACSMNGTILKYEK